MKHPHALLAAPRLTPVGGQQRRIAVARALANAPSVILADEPTAALDSHRGRQVMEFFRNVAHQHGAGVIVVTTTTARWKSSTRSTRWKTGPSRRAESHTKRA